MDTNSIIIKKLLQEIDFKISPDKNIRNLYIYRLKKKIYKIFNKEKNFINSITKFKFLNQNKTKLNFYNYNKKIKNLF